MRISNNVQSTNRVILAKNNLHLLREQIGITYSDNQVIINENEMIALEYFNSEWDNR